MQDDKVKENNMIFFISQITAPACKAGSVMQKGTCFYLFNTMSCCPAQHSLLRKIPISRFQANNHGLWLTFEQCIKKSFVTAWFK